jgi:hypothetical protein
MVTTVRWMPWQAPDGHAYLARTFYQDVEYVMPDRVMQPIWDSVKNAKGEVDYRLNEHRAYYNKCVVLLLEGIRV